MFSTFEQLMMIPNDQYFPGRARGSLCYPLANQNGAKRCPILQGVGTTNLFRFSKADVVILPGPGKALCG